MHVRVSRVRRKGKLYEYVQLVESYRRASDGMPAHRVIANLGRRSPQEVANLKAALRAGREGGQVVFAETADQVAKAPKPSANLRYLDVAVLVELWRDLGLDEVLGEVMPIGDADVAPGDVVAALAVQRCTDPGSKLFATRWYPRTALPELLGVTPKQFNNTRLHRVLDGLDAATAALMRRLPQLYESRDGAFGALFLDVTDTWFEGHGPTLAERGKTKQEVVKRKIAIVLLCNEHGYPLRWEVVNGNCHDSKSMGRMVRHLGGQQWAARVPVVMDRAMGCTAHLRRLLATGIHFITALTSTEFPAYVPLLPHEQLSDLHVDARNRNKSIEQALSRLERSGMRRVRDDRLLLDLGIVERADDERSDLDGLFELEQDATVRAMDLCRTITEGVTNGDFASYQAAGRALGLSASLTHKYRKLRRLACDLQQEVLEGAVSGRPLRDLIAVSCIEDRQQQRDAFDALKQRKPVLAGKNHRMARPPRAEPDKPVRVRAVACFHPKRFVKQRLRAQRTLGTVEQFIDNLNAELASGTNLDDKRVAASIDRMLRAHEVRGLYEATITERKNEQGPHLCVTLTFNRAEWARRRSRDGFTVFIAHPDITLDDEAIDRLYWAKDRVEKDFQTIKGLVKLRPVHHRTDAKVRAHVAVCMLALILERALGQKLANTTFTAEHALELLAGCHLNAYRAKRGDAAYTITVPDDEQAQLLAQLRLKHLVDDDRLMARITPR